MINKAIHHLMVTQELLQSYRDEKNETLDCVPYIIGQLQEIIVTLGKEL
jgi:hypothetical protein